MAKTSTPPTPEQPTPTMPQQRPRAQSMGSLHSEDARDRTWAWAVVYRGAIAEARGEQPDVQAVLYAIRERLGFRDMDSAQAKYRAIVSEMRVRLEDQATVASKSDVSARLAAAQSRLNELRPWTDQEITRLRAELRTAESQFQNLAREQSAIAQAEQRLAEGVPAFIGEQRASVAAALAGAHKRMGEIDTEIQRLEQVRSLSVEDADDARARIRRGESSVLLESARAGYFSRLDDLRAIAGRIGVAVRLDTITATPCVEHHDNLALRRLVLERVPAHQDSLAAECARIVVVLRDRRVSIEDEIVDAERALQAVEFEAAHWDL